MHTGCFKLQDCLLKRQGANILKGTNNIPDFLRPMVSFDFCHIIAAVRLKVMEFNVKIEKNTDAVLHFKYKHKYK